MRMTWPNRWRVVVAVGLVFALAGSAWAEYCPVQGTPRIPKNQSCRSRRYESPAELLTTRPGTLSCDSGSSVRGEIRQRRAVTILPGCPRRRRRNWKRRSLRNLWPVN